MRDNRLKILRKARKKVVYEFAKVSLDVEIMAEVQKIEKNFKPWKKQAHNVCEFLDCKKPGDKKLWKAYMNNEDPYDAIQRLRNGEK